MNNVYFHEQNTMTHVTADNPELAWPWLYRLLTPYIPPDQMDEDFIPPGSSFEKSSGTFPRGFTAFVAYQMSSLGFRVHQTRPQQPVRAPDYRPPVGELRHLQAWAVDEMLKHDYGVLDIATRFGKSYTYAGWYARMGRPMTLILVPRAAIAQQMRDELEAWLGEPVGLIAGSVNPIPQWQNLTVAIELSLLENNGLIRQEHLPYLHCIEARIKDEAHIYSRAHGALVRAMPWCRWAWAGSATPFVNDPLKNWDLQAWYGDSRIRVSSKMLADRGILAPVEAHFHVCEHEPWAGGDNWDPLYKSEVVNHTARNSLIAEIARHELARGRTGVIFVNHVKQAKNLLPNIPGAKIVASKLLTRGQSENIKREFNSGETACVMVTKMWREGVTLYADFGINAEGGKADHVLVQKLGRGLLPKVSGAAFRWHDIWDRGQGTLHQHTRARVDSLTREEWPWRKHESFKEFVALETDPVRQALSELDAGLETIYGQT